MNASAAVAVAGGRVARLRSEPPLVLRAVTPTELWLVGGAAGPMGGDDLRLSVDVGPQDRLAVRSAGAQLALPGPRAHEVAHLDVEVGLGAGASLRWTPEPTVAVRGCRFEARTTVRMASDAHLWWQEELVLGRFGEASGDVSSRVRVEVDGVVVVHHEHSLHPASVGDARVVVTVVVAGPGLEDAAPVVEDDGALLPSDGPAVVVIALGHQLDAARRQVRHLIRRAALPLAEQFPASTR